MKILKGVTSVMTLEIFLGNWLIDGDIFAIYKVLGSHFLHSVQLNLSLVAYHWFFGRLTLKQIYISSFVGCFVMIGVCSEFEMSFSQVIFHILV